MERVRTRRMKTSLMERSTTSDAYQNGTAEAKRLHITIAAATASNKLSSKESIGQPTDTTSRALLNLQCFGWFLFMLMIQLNARKGNHGVNDIDRWWLFIVSLFLQWVSLFELRRLEKGKILKDFVIEIMMSRFYYLLSIFGVQQGLFLDTHLFENTVGSDNI